MSDFAVGGFRPLPTAEDHALVEDLRTAGVPLLRTTRIPVVTSARARARAPRGFSWLLGTLAGADAPFPGRGPGLSELDQGLSQRRAGTPG